MGLRKAAVVALIAMSASGVVASPPTGRTQAGWHREPGAGSVPNVGTYSVALPPGMQQIPVTGIGSFVAEYRSRTLALLFDFGAHPGPAPPSCRARMRCSIGTLAVGGGHARRIWGYMPDPDGGLPYRADYDIRFPGDGASAARGITLTI